MQNHNFIKSFFKHAYSDDLHLMIIPAQMSCNYFSVASLWSRILPGYDFVNFYFIPNFLSKKFVFLLIYERTQNNQDKSVHILNIFGLRNAREIPLYN